MRERPESLAAYDRRDLAVLPRRRGGYLEPLHVRREIVAVGRDVKGLRQHFGVDIEVAYRKYRVSVGADEIYQRLPHLRQRGVLDVEDAVEHAVYGQQHRCLADEPVRHAHVHEPHQLRAAADDDAAVDDALHTAAGEILKVIYPACGITVILHQLAEHFADTASRRAYHAPREGDYALRITVGKDAHIFKLNAALRKEVAVGNDEVLAAADVAQPGPARYRRAAGEDAQRAEQERQRKAQQRRNGHSGGEDCRIDKYQVAEALLDRGDDYRQQQRREHQRQRRLLEYLLVGRGLFRPVDEAGERAQRLEQRYLMRLDVHLTGHGVRAAAYRRYAQRLAHPAAAYQRACERADERERGDAAERDVRA